MYDHLFLKFGGSSILGKIFSTNWQIVLADNGCYLWWLMNLAHPTLANFALQILGTDLPIYTYTYNQFTSHMVYKWYRNCVQLIRDMTRIASMPAKLPGKTIRGILHTKSITQLMFDKSYFHEKKVLAKAGITIQIDEI